MNLQMKALLTVVLKVLRFDEDYLFAHELQMFHALCFLFVLLKKAAVEYLNISSSNERVNWCHSKMDDLIFSDIYFPS